jgi:hypothetical protein
MSDNLAKIEVLVPDFQYVDSDHNRVVMTVGFSASFYFWGGHTPAKRQALIECVEAFEAAYGGYLRWGMDEDAGRRVKLADNKLPPLRQYAKSLDEDDCISWYLASGDDTKAVSDYAISCLTERGWMDGEISVLRFQVPRALVFQPEGQKVLSDLIFLCYVRLEPFHGNAGLTAISTYDEVEWEPEKLDVATRYLALYNDDRVGDAMQAPRGVKSVNWLTFIGNTLTQRLGGPDAFAAYCRRFGVESTQHGSGFLIRAGEYPQLGPIDELAPDAYVRVNAALRPLRNGNFGSMGTGSVNGERRFNRCTSDLWIRRFDAPGIWPPATFVGLPRTPVGKPPSKKISLKTGETCSVHGRYRHPGFEPVAPGNDDGAPQVVLLPGDAAPYWLKLGPHGEYLGRDDLTWELVTEL